MFGVSHRSTVPQVSCAGQEYCFHMKLCHRGIFCFLLVLRPFGWVVAGFLKSVCIGVVVFIFILT